ncbi:tRNA glutamyl-Q(34) synthetase GluQRS [Erythrobacter rubeus]|uniref:tRNA glutamyl-Q(34) synthetase GluQRS n=1 Tax=Erythrobacter rubeus TaxID=2760803 RepID=A0ABR8KRN5_9SPHN|nr:tRNA glutamyl-Q(34) synthetase GluQRS [Erythrobacter rubeus]MBD2843428.1 tRNA glutamyl-Q(34) synthetase GluQRS [Erythrobacter rubeus]
MNTTPALVTRFAPSPNGHLHMGHAFSAIYAHDLAKSAGGQFLLRIEDIDGPRSRPEYADEFRRDLEWLGLEWEEVAPQSDRLESYQDAAGRLLATGLAYKCACTRKDIEALDARKGDDGVIYPGTCKGRCAKSDEPAATRLDVDKAMNDLGELIWIDEEAGSVIADPREFGDVVIVRKDLPASYHLAATLDDAADGVTVVTRGADLFAATHVHRILQELFELPTPHYHHHDLLLDNDGQKLAKRRGSPALASRRESGEDGLMLAEQLRLQQSLSGT